MKRAVRLRRDADVAELGDPVGDAPIANEPLRRHQDRTLAACGYAVEDAQADDGSAELVFDEALWVTRPLLAAFLRAARRAGPGTWQLGLPEDELTRLLAFPGTQPTVDGLVLYPLTVRLGGHGGGPLPLAVAVGGVREVIRFSSTLPGMADQPVVLTDKVAVVVDSWVQLWLANLYGLVDAWSRRLRSPLWWPWLAWVLFRGLAGARSLRPFDAAVSALGRLNVVGRRSRIHPSAVVEGCVVGDDVEIGPLCVVRGCVVGDGVRILDHSLVSGCVLGDGVLINQWAMVVGALVYPKAVLSWLQTGVVGRGSFLGALFRPMDMKLSGTIRTRHRGGLVDTGMPFLGCCIGHGCVVTMDTKLLPGRVLPNGVQLMTEPGAVAEVPDDVPRGRLVLEKKGRLEW